MFAGVTTDSTGRVNGNIMEALCILIPFSVFCRLYFPDSLIRVLMNVESIPIMFRNLLYTL